MRADEEGGKVSFYLYLFFSIFSETSKVNCD